MYFEDKFHIFTIFGDMATGKFQLMKDKQFRSPEEWQLHVNKNLRQEGIFCPMSKVNVLVTCNRVEGVEFDYDQGCYYKIYKEKPDILPLSLVMRRRDPKHPLNALSVRTSEKPEREILKGQQAVCLNIDKFGLIGTVERVDPRSNTITMNFDVETE